MYRFRFVLMAGVLLISACGGDSGGGETATTSEPAPTTVASTSPATTAVPTDPTIQFDGASCTYVGPAEFESGTLPLFTIRNTGSIDFNFVLLAVDDGLDYPTARGLVHGFREDGAKLPEGVRERSGSGIVGPGEEQTTNVPFTAAGSYLPACETFPFEWFVAAGFVSVP